MQTGSMRYAKCTKPLSHGCGLPVLGGRLVISDREELKIMLLKKLFKQRKPPEAAFDPGEEPARHSAPPSPDPLDLRKRTEQRLKPKSGFDPYNSGTFKKENAWERVTRK